MFRSVASGCFRWGHSSRRMVSTFYEMFPKSFPGGEPSFNVDQSQLRKEYRVLQSQFHPDMVAGNGDGADMDSSVVNKAYHVLKEPLSRSQYMIKINKGIDLTEDGQKLEVGPSILMEVIEINERLADDSISNDEIARIKQENDDRMDAIVNKLRDCFEQEDYSTAVELTMELKYWTNLSNTIKNI
ncbi:hypothetical protein KAFR_0F03210 [Kazachstania africana CBS 2517]|uniref:J domain-containing protein n=1 Tax=Kazachstania africana (strain ATCC 22294 / BCRC 22015 / CBS 2517 / CECT 1963 / NBRC 1671 / NRRL Y-8276) TaxID=1071382 RepID=H2AX17_KAZAF|nr:hypothetical protein KAFR_0F03210 [Kazachstania africana CBS 2517]CCF58917.1 hypothetical protein KAFR_0F03210 [Kazachstania africana CBS 2517]